MVYTGKPSKGCSVCRKRKIKCDEASPGCSYCFKKQIVCPGYKSQFDIAWRDQNAVAEKSVQRRKRTAETQKGGQGMDQQLLVSSSSPKVPSQDIEGYALNFFFSSYILPRDAENRRDILDHLYPIWLNADAASPLMPAVSAVASVMLEAWSQLRPGVPESLSRSKFTKALAALRVSLQQNRVVGHDVLMAALMLDMYQTLTSFITMSRPQQSPHINGVAELVRKSRPLLLANSNATSRSLLPAVRNYIIGRSIRDKQMVPPSIVSCKVLGSTTGERLDYLGLEVANLQALAVEISDHTDSGIVESVLSEIQDLDLRLIKWAMAVPEDWTPVEVWDPECIPQAVRKAGLYQQHCDVFKSVFVAHTFNEYRSRRIKLQLAMINCLEHCNKSFDLSLEIIQNLADATCASVPFYLGDRTKIGRIDDKSAQYPHLPGVVVSDEHLLAAAAYAGWMISKNLSELLLPEVPLRAGQKQWIGGQLWRVQGIYAVQAKDPS